MSDFEKVYSIKFDVATALKNLDKLERKITDIKKSGLITYLNSVRGAFNTVGKTAEKTGRTLEKEFGRGAQRNLKALGTAGKQAAAGIEHIPKAVTRAGISLSDLGRNLNRWVLAPMAAVSAASIKAAFDINKGMANISTLTTQTPEQIRAMRKEVQGLMVDMGKSTEDITGGLYQVISALGESDDNLGQLRGAAKAAVAGLSDTKSSVEMLTAVAKAYNDTSAESIAHTSDLAFQTVKLGVTTFPELAASIGKVAPLAAQFNTSQEELFGTMATLTGVTGSTAEVVTQLASSYAAFMKPSEDMEEAVRSINKANKEYNFESAGAMLKTLGYKKTIELLGAAAGGSEEKLMGMFRRKEAILGILPLISSQSENFTKKVEAMATAAGATDEAFRKQTEGINKAGFSFDKAKQRMIVMAQRIGDRLLPMVEKGIGYLEKFTGWFESLSDESIDTALNIGKVVVQFVLMVNALRAINAIGNTAFAFVGVFNSGFGTFSSNVTTATTKVAGLSKAMSGLKGTVSVLGALALGYTLGELINEGIIEPERRKKEKARTEEGNRAISATLNPENMTTEQLENEKTYLMKKYEQSKYRTGSVGRRFLMSESELQDEERFKVSAMEGIGSITQELEKRRSGLSLLESEQKGRQQSGENYYDPDAVIRGQRAEIGGISQDVNAARTQQMYFTPQNTPVTINQTTNISASQSRLEDLRRIAKEELKKSEERTKRRLENAGYNVRTQ